MNITTKGFCKNRVLTAINNLNFIIGNKITIFALCINGSVAKWSNAPDCKSGSPAFGGSNPPRPTEYV